MKPARLPTPLALQLTNPQGFWYRVHPNCRRKPVLNAVSRDRFERLQ